MKKETRQIRRRKAREVEKNKNRNLSTYNPYLGNRMVRRNSLKEKRVGINNRKRTRGRNIQYQLVPLFKGKLKKNRIIVGFKTLKHLIPSQMFIKIQRIIIEKTLSKRK
jgi:hypothetical protein